CALCRILHNAHGLRDLAGLYRFDPDGQVWARSMADLLIDANAQATAARAAGQASLDDERLARIRSWYRGAVAKGLADNAAKTSQIAADGRTLARRFRDHEDMILRFTTDLAVGFTSNQADYAEFGVMRTRRWMPWHAGEAGLARPA
ncbi:MAG TPA: transposase, partial [Streptosporangiaceae bacterium]|nr:transposase [Streptosporangiaceae bacterium]